MAHEIFRALSNLRFPLDTETDADSPDNETTFAAMREALEMLYRALLYAGDDGTLTSDPPDDATGVATDTAGGYSVDEHNGRTLLFTSGLAKGSFYTIDDTTATTLICTGDNLYSDGARSGDDYIVLFDIITPTSGHTHDAINSANVVLADASITESKYSPGSVDQTALKTTTVEITWATASSHQVVTGAGSYAFWPQIKETAGGGDLLVQVASGYDGGATYATIVWGVMSGASGYAQFRYVQASGEVFWLFVLREKVTKKLILTSAAPDHPCFGNGGKPKLTAHPFIDVFEENDKLYLPSKCFLDGNGQREVEIIVINPSSEDVKKIKEAGIEADEEKPDRCFSQVFIEDYVIDDMVEPDWPDKPVTVGLSGDNKTVIKKVIPKPDMVRTAAIVKK